MFAVRTRVERSSSRPRRTLFIDGGLLSNLPVWAFNEDKKIVERFEQNASRRPIPIIAFTLAEDGIAATAAPSANYLRGFVDYGTGVVKTGIFGGQTIVQDFVQHLTVVKMPTPLSLIQFDCTRDEALKAYQGGVKAAEDALKRDFQEYPFGRRAVLGRLIQTAIERSAALATPDHPAVTQFRACVVEQLGNRSFKVVASLNMDGDADDDLVLDQNNPGAPAAFLQRRVTHVRMHSDAGKLRMTKYERALVRKDVASVIAIPIFTTAQAWTQADKPMPVGAFCLDSDSDLSIEYDDRLFMQGLALGSVGLASFVQGVAGGDS